MNTAAGAPDGREAARRLFTVLEGTRPNHAADSLRLGASLASGADERLRPLFPPAPRPAAVLIGLVDREEGPGILLTVRAPHLRHHAGQIAFPGGRIEASDADPAAAALREAEEEIGLAPAAVRVLGYLPDHLILTGFRVTPVVARVSLNAPLRYDPGEVQETFELPWSHLIDDRYHRAYRRSIAGTEVDVRDIQFGAHTIWGATAAMLFCLRALALGGT